MSKIKTRRISPREKRNTTIRVLLYGVLMLVCFLFETAGNFQKPLLFLPLAVCIASYAKEHTAVVAGILCGLLLDIVTGKLLGFHAILLVLVCMGVSMLYKHFLMHRFITFLVLNAAVVMVQGILDFFFYYAIWNYEHTIRIYTHHILPNCVLTMLSGIIIYPIIHNLNRLLRPNVIRTIEETVPAADV